MLPLPVPPLKARKVCAWLEGKVRQNRHLARGRSRAGSGSDGTRYRDRCAMGDARGRKVKSGRCELKGDGTPVVHQHIGIDRAEATGQIVARPRSILLQGVPTVAVGIE